MAALSITAEQTPSLVPRVYFVDDNTRFVWLAKAPQSAAAAAAASAASASDASSSGDVATETAAHDSHQTPALTPMQNPNQSQSQSQNRDSKPAAAADAFAAIGGLGAQIEVRYSETRVVNYNYNHPRSYFQRHVCCMSVNCVTRIFLRQ